MNEPRYTIALVDLELESAPDGDIVYVADASASDLATLQGLSGFVTLPGNLGDVLDGIGKAAANLMDGAVTPPDSEACRAEDAADALRAYREARRARRPDEEDDTRGYLSDLMADLLHFAAREGLVAAELHRWAWWHYVQETADAELDHDAPSGDVLKPGDDGSGIYYSKGA